MEIALNKYNRKGISIVTKLAVLWPDSLNKNNNKNNKKTTKIIKKIIIKILLLI